MPEWLRQEVEATPLWYIIREAKEVRRAHPYLLIEELRKQPSQWREIQRNLRAEIERVAETIVARSTKEIIFIGCGSAFFTAIHGEFVVERLSGVRCRAIESFELLHYFPEVDPARTAVIGHSGTGGSIETREALQEAGKRGCQTVTIVNTPGSPLAALAERSLCYETAQGCGPCISVISTRIVIQTLLGLELAKQAGINPARVKALEPQIERCAAIGEAFLEMQDDTVRSLAERYMKTSSFFLVGTGPNYFSAREGTLKIEEESICVGKAYRPGDFHHDVISILGPTNCTIAIAGNENTNLRIAECLDVAAAAESGTIAVVFEGNRRKHLSEPDCGAAGARDASAGASRDRTNVVKQGEVCLGGIEPSRPPAEHKSVYIAARIQEDYLRLDARVIYWVLLSTGSCLSCRCLRYQGHCNQHNENHPGQHKRFFHDQPPLMSDLHFHSL